MLKIVILSTLTKGGAAIAAQEVQRALNLAGHKTLFCSFQPDQSAIPLAAPDRIWKQNARSFSELFTYWYSLGVQEKINAAGNELLTDGLAGFYDLSSSAAEAIAQADVVNIHWMAGIWASPPLLAAMAGKKVIITLHDMNPLTGGCHYHLTCDNFEKQCGNCPCLSAPDRLDLSHQTWQLKNLVYEYLNPSVVTPSRWLSDVARRSSLLGTRPVHTITHSQDLHMFRPLSPHERADLRAREGIAEDSLVILTGAQDIENTRKNIKILFDSMNLLYADGINFECIVFGEGILPELPYPVRHMSTVSRERLRNIYGMADIFIHPSKIDALSLTLCEAQCCGTPVMSFDAGGTLDTFIDGQTGFLIKEMTARAVADKLAQVSKNPEILREMRPAARAFAEKHFDPEILSRRYVDVFAATTPSKRSFTEVKGLDVQIKQISNKIFQAPKLNTRWIMGKLQKINQKFYRQ